MAKQATHKRVEGMESRRYHRHQVNLKMTYTILAAADATPYEYGIANAKNLSEAGVCIFSEHEIRVPILMQLNINLPVKPYHLLVLGKALRCEPVPDSNLFEVGMKFVGILPPQFKSLIAEIAPLMDQDGNMPSE